MKNEFQPLPKWTSRFFRWICHPEYYEELHGDLLEKFNENYKEKGSVEATKLYRREVFFMLRPSVFRKPQIGDWIIFQPAILKSYSKIAIRNIQRHKLFSAINIIGLAIGMCVSLLILSLLADLQKFDEFHEDKDRIFRVITNATISNYREDRLATTALPLSDILIENINGVENLTQIRRFFNAEASANNKVLPLSGHLTDPDFFDIFTFPFISGSPSKALIDPYSIVLTQKAALKVFGEKDPFGELIHMGSYGDFVVTGVIEDLPKHSHLQFEVLGSMSTLPVLEKNGIVNKSMADWDDVYTNCIYLKLVEGVDPVTVSDDLNRVVQPRFEAFEKLDASFELQALPKIIPGPELSNKIGPSMSHLPLFILSGIAFLILLSSCFNYTNLSIARLLRRSREVGIRKVSGAGKGQVVLQFLTESIIIALFALGLGIVFFHLIRPGFFQIIPRADQFALDITPTLILIFVGFAIASGLIAGLVPSIILSRVQPVHALKNVNSDRVRKKYTLRKALITFQFVISLIFIVGTSIVLKQYRYSLNKDLGFNGENILNVSLYNVDHQLFENEISRVPDIAEMSFSSLIPGLGSTSTNWVVPRDGIDSTIAFYMSVSENYLDNHDIPIISGVDFSEGGLGARDGIIINKTFAEYIAGQVNDALNRIVRIGQIEYSIVGVSEDFNYTHLEEPIENFFFLLDPDSYSVANLKLSSDDMGKTMGAMKDIWNRLGPEHSFEAHFLEDQLDTAYDFLRNAMTLFGFLAFLAISIACLGMLGMAMYAAETRRKEVSIRKVFGASVWSILRKMSSNFVLLLGIAACIALPIVYFLFDQLILSNFAFRVDIGLVEMLIGLVLVMFLGFLTIGSQMYHLANVNPAETLRGE